MILLDADVLLIDLRYPNDAKYATNLRALDALRSVGQAVGITAQALLEVVGILSFNLGSVRVPRLARQLAMQYGLTVVPDFDAHPDYAGCSVDAVIAELSKQMALGDAVQSAQIQRFARGAECLLTWNAKHFSGKLVIPVMTPQEWLDGRAP